LAGRDLSPGERFLPAQLAMEKGRNLADADRAHHRRQRGQVSLQQ
jgi:hypothetical protein